MAVVWAACQNIPSVLKIPQGMLKVFLSIFGWISSMSWPSSPFLNSRPAGKALDWLKNSQSALLTAEMHGDFLLPWRSNKSVCIKPVTCSVLWVSFFQKPSWFEDFAIDKSVHPFVVSMWKFLLWWSVGRLVTRLVATTTGLQPSFWGYTSSTQKSRGQKFQEKSSCSEKTHGGHHGFGRRCLTQGLHQL